MEKIIFRDLMQAMSSGVEQVTHADDKSDNVPDFYCRTNSTVILFEFKANLFADTLIEHVSADDFVQHIEERFIRTSAGQPKGILQLKNQIEHIRDGKFSFDDAIPKDKMTIYPIICYDDFHYSMAGLNEYLNNRFQQEIAEVSVTMNIRPLTMISLSVINDTIEHGGSFQDLPSLIDQYWQIIRNRKLIFVSDQHVDTFLSTKSSFDEIFRTNLRSTLPGKDDRAFSTKSISDVTGIMKEELDEKF